MSERADCIVKVYSLNKEATLHDKRRDVERVHCWHQCQLRAGWLQLIHSKQLLDRRISRSLRWQHSCADTALRAIRKQQKSEQY